MGSFDVDMIMDSVNSGQRIKQAQLYSEIKNCVSGFWIFKKDKRSPELYLYKANQNSPFMRVKNSPEVLATYAKEIGLSEIRTSLRELKELGYTVSRQDVYLSSGFLTNIREAPIEQSFIKLTPSMLSKIIEDVSSKSYGLWEFRSPLEKSSLFLTKGKESDKFYLGAYCPTVFPCAGNCDMLFVDRELKHLLRSEFLCTYHIVAHEVEFKIKSEYSVENKQFDTSLEGWNSYKGEQVMEKINKPLFQRETCLFCVSKHLSQAQVLLTEAVLGYPLHKWLAVGHLAEAESECFAEFPEFSKKIRRSRLELMGQECTEDCLTLMQLLEEARKHAEEVNGHSEDLSMLSKLI